ncbi:MAG: endonuclease MutS2 [Chloroflexi bacterium]|nr:endonuclease MutS2 [Chloroflexota bacterium]
MDEKSLEVLEFPQVRQILAGFTSFSASRELAANLKPITDFERISLLLKQSAEARHLLSLETGFSIGGVSDIREKVKMAARGKVLEPPGLLEIQHSLAAISQLRSSLSRLAKTFPLLWEIAGGISELRQLERRINSCIAPTGELLDSASARLSSVRIELRRAREQLEARLNAIMKSPRGQRIIQEQIITEREGRYVIPVKIEYRKELKGIVHDVSNTGATVFVEPWVTMEMGNTLRELVTEERREVEKILRDLSAGIGAYETEISQSVAMVAELDLAIAKARYARKARAAEPVIISSSQAEKDGTAGVVKLVEARHPLLGDKAVPLSVELGRDFSILVITGPNTGGKTVALKTIGLLSLMAQAGMPIPASAESLIPVFDGVFADIGDEQSIEQTLSTFSWHIGNIKRIINNATAGSLVLLDELGTSTDPAEGSALARAILGYFRSRRTMVVATTHFSDLKAFAHMTPGLQNASLDFDPVTLAPTYHLMVGVPGGSNALATASRLGLPSEIIAGARGMLSKGSQDLEALLANLMREKQQVEALRRDLSREREEFERRNAGLENELERLKTAEQKAIREARDRVVSEVAELHREIRQATSDLRKAKTRESIEQARRAATAARERLKSGPWRPEGGESPLAITGKIVPGDTVRLKETSLQATVLSVAEATQEIEVQAGQSRFRLSLDGVEKVTAGDKITPVFAPAKSQLSGRTASFELDLRGKRADEIEWLLDRYLNDALVSNLSEVRIIHGIATGTVRKIVRETLAKHPLVKSFRPGGQGEGGDGVTVATL